LFNQTQVPAHAELQWLLTGTARMGWLNRMTQWKDKAGKNREGASVALFTYPVLQAADVAALSGDATCLWARTRSSTSKLARDIAQKFNNRLRIGRCAGVHRCPRRSSRPRPPGS